MRSRNYIMASVSVAALAAASASAAEMDLEIGGFMSQHVAYVDNYGTAIVGQDLDGFDMHSDTEIWFMPSIELESGLTFGAQLEFEGENGPGDTEIDENYMHVSSDTLGRVEIGSTNSAGYKMTVAAPEVTSMQINSPSISTFIPFTAAYTGGSVPAFGFRQAAISSFTEVAGNNDVSRISYYTPSFEGFSAGISYAPTGSMNAANSYGIDKKNVLHDIYDVGLRYDGQVGDVGLVVSARYGTGKSPFIGVSDPQTWGIGTQVSYQAWTVGAAYAVNDNGAPGGISFNIAGSPNAPGTSNGVAGNFVDHGSDNKGWSLGVTYDVAGPWSFGASTYQGEIQGGAYDRTYTAYKVGANRDLGPGVDFDVYAVQVDADNGFPGAGNGNVGGLAVGTGLNITF